MNYLCMFLLAFQCITLVAKPATTCSHESTCSLLQELYDAKKINGFHIQPEEHALINKCGGASTYGEITDEAARTLFETLKPTANDVLVDLGSGCGRFCVYALNATPMKKVIGVELSPTRSKQAQGVKELLIKNKQLPAGKKLHLLEADFLKADLSDVTIVYMASTCFSEELMKKIADKLAQTKQKKLIVVTLRRLPEHKRFELITTITLPMTWSNKTPAYIYKLI